MRVKEKVRLKSVLTIITTFCFLVLYAQETTDTLPKRIIPGLFLPYHSEGKPLHDRSTFKVKKRTPYINQLPLFCRIEELMTIEAKFPVKIRIGSIDYVDRLEGKGIYRN